jgi:flavorubredoxin
VQSGDTLNIGKRTLHFQQLQMVHWPDSMATYLPDEKLLLPNDAFGQHIASAERFDDEMGWDIIYQEAAKYYANIVFHYADPVQKALDAVSTLDIDMIAPSHGVIWRKNIERIINAYSAWAKNESENRALIIYDSMWGTTEKIARTLQESLEAEGVPVTMRNLKTNHISDIMTDVLFSKMILLGSPTLNKGLLPTMGAFLTYLKGLRPQNRIGFAFSSYGWGGLALKEMEEVIKGMGWQTPVEGINIKYIPDENELNDVREKGAQLAKLLKET